MPFYNSLETNNEKTPQAGFFEICIILITPEHQPYAESLQSYNTQHPVFS